jgi:hypothetical protein
MYVNQGVGPGDDDKHYVPFAKDNLCPVGSGLHILRERMKWRNGAGQPVNILLANEIDVSRAQLILEDSNKLCQDIADAVWANKESATVTAAAESSSSLSSLDVLASISGDASEWRKKTNSSGKKKLEKLKRQAKRIAGKIVSICRGHCISDKNIHYGNILNSHVSKPQLRKALDILALEGIVNLRTEKQVSIGAGRFDTHWSLSVVPTESGECARFINFLTNYRVSAEEYETNATLDPLPFSEKRRSGKRKRDNATASGTRAVISVVATPVTM